MLAMAIGLCKPRGHHHGLGQLPWQLQIRHLTGLDHGGEKFSGFRKSAIRECMYNKERGVALQGAHEQHAQ